MLIWIASALPSAVFAPHLFIQCSGHRKNDHHRDRQPATAELDFRERGAPEPNGLRRLLDTGLGPLPQNFGLEVVNLGACLDELIVGGGDGEFGFADFHARALGRGDQAVGEVNVGFHLLQDLVHLHAVLPARAGFVMAGGTGKLAGSGIQHGIAGFHNEMIAVARLALFEPHLGKRLGERAFFE